MHSDDLSVFKDGSFKLFSPRHSPGETYRSSATPVEMSPSPSLARRITRWNGSVHRTDSSMILIAMSTFDVINQEPFITISPSMARRMLNEKYRSDRWFVSFSIWKQNERQSQWSRLFTSWTSTALCEWKSRAEFFNVSDSDIEMFGTDWSLVVAFGSNFSFGIQPNSFHTDPNTLVRLEFVVFARRSSSDQSSLPIQQRTNQRDRANYGKAMEDLVDCWSSL